MPKSQNKSKNKPAIRALSFLIVGTMVLLIFLVIALLLSPKATMPYFNITDQQGEWRAQGTIAVFDDEIKPGSEGSYKFVIKSESEGNLRYGFKLTEFLGNIDQEANPFMQYRLKVANIPIDDDWHYAGFNYGNIDIKPGSEHELTLEWRWPFNNDMDENDNLIGIAGGQLSVTLFLWTEVVY